MNPEEDPLTLEERWTTLVNRWTRAPPRKGLNPDIGRLSWVVRNPELQQRFRGWTLLHLACFIKRSASLELIRYLIDDCEVPVTAPDYGAHETPFEVACGRGFIHAAAFLRSRGSPLGEGLHRACVAGETSTAYFLVRWMGVPVDVPMLASPPDDPDTLFALPSALEWTAMCHGPTKIAELLLELGANRRGVLPSACMWGHVELVRWWIARGLPLDDASWGMELPELLCADPFHAPLHREWLEILDLLERAGRPVPREGRRGLATLYALCGRADEAVAVLTQLDPTTDPLPRVWDMLDGLLHEALDGKGVCEPQARAAVQKLLTLPVAVDPAQAPVSLVARMLRWMQQMGGGAGIGADLDLLVPGRA